MLPSTTDNNRAGRNAFNPLAEQATQSLVRSAYAIWPADEMKKIDSKVPRDVNEALTLLLAGPEVYTKRSHAAVEKFGQRVKELFGPAAGLTFRIGNPGLPDCVAEAKISPQTKQLCRGAEQVFLGASKGLYGEASVNAVYRNADMVHQDKMHQDNAHKDKPEEGIPDYASAFSRWFFGPNLYNKLGPENMRCFGRQAIMFGIMPALEAVEEAKRQWKNAGAVVKEGGADWLLGHSAGLLSHSLPGAGQLVGVAGLAALAKDQFLDAKHQERNWNLWQLGCATNKLSEEQFVAAWVKAKGLIAPDVCHGALALTIGGLAFERSAAGGKAANEILAAQTFGKTKMVQMPVAAELAYKPAAVTEQAGKQEMLAASPRSKNVSEMQVTSPAKAAKSRLLAKIEADYSRQPMRMKSELNKDSACETRAHDLLTEKQSQFPNSPEPRSERTHLSKKPIAAGVDSGSPGNDCKPNGLWYGLDHDWVDYCAKTMGPEQMAGHHIYKVDLADAKILCLQNEKDAQNFEALYGFDLPDSSGSMPASMRSRLLQIDWPKVAQDYDGIEFGNYYQLKTTTPALWAYGLDCDSGCVWNASKVKVSAIGQLPAIDTLPISESSRSHLAGGGDIFDLAEKEMDAVEASLKQAYFSRFPDRK